MRLTVLGDSRKNSDRGRKGERELRTYPFITRSAKVWFVSAMRERGLADEAIAHDRYTLTHVDFNGESYKSQLLAYLEIHDGKIWILTDNTEDGIAAELVAEGIAKSEIVLGFYPLALREAGEFTVQ